MDALLPDGSINWVENNDADGFDDPGAEDNS